MKKVHLPYFFGYTSLYIYKWKLGLDVGAPLLDVKIYFQSCDIILM